MLSFFVLIIGFTYFYVSITFNPTEVADNMKKYGGFIPGIRPGNPTPADLTYVLSRLTAPGSFYRLRRAPAEIKLSEIIRLVDGPLAPFGDADQLRGLIITDPDHRALYSVFLEVRDAAAKILENTSVADIVGDSSKSRKPSGAKKKAKKGPALSIVHKAAKSK